MKVLHRSLYINTSLSGIAMWAVLFYGFTLQKNVRRKRKRIGKIKLSLEREHASRLSLVELLAGLEPATC